MFAQRRARMYSAAMNLRRVALMVLILAATSSATPAFASTLPDTCGAYDSGQSGGIFDPAGDSTEYSSDGYLIYRLHLKNPSAPGDTFNLRFQYFLDTCRDVTLFASGPLVTLPAGVSDVSIRFTSRTEYGIWDDTHETLLNQVSIESYPAYISIRPTLIASPTSFYIGHTHKIYRDGVPPIVESAVEKPAACPPLQVQTDGLWFDHGYERAEYVDGLLRVHLRFLDRVVPADNFPRFNFRQGVVPVTNEDCTFSAPLNSLPSIIAPYHSWYYSYRFIDATHWVMWDDERNVPFSDVSGLCNSCSGTIPEGTKYVYWLGDRNGRFMRTTPFPPVEPTTRIDPVIMIPGILGSDYNENGELVMDPILHKYDDLIATLDANVYTQGTDLFTFPYNWRLSNMHTALLLKAKIDEVKAICQCDKVDLVAHSMGGLVARQYIQSSSYENDVDQLIFLGTPHRGAPNSYLMWEGGEVEAGLRDRAMEHILGQEAHEQGYDDLFDYVRNEPITSVRELLPVYDYVFDNGDLRDYPENYPTNPFLENLNANVNELLGSGVSISNIVGENGSNETIIGINATNGMQYLPMWEHGYPENFYLNFGDHGLVRGQGDGTVPFASATFVAENVSTTTFEHTAIPEEAQAEIYEILTGESATTLVDNWNLVNAKLLFFKMFSPADFYVMAPDGKKVGKNVPESEKIPGSFYSGFTSGPEYVTILNPLDGEYKIVTEGTGSGSYTVEAALLSDEEVVESSFTGNTTSGLLTELNVVLDSNNPNEIEVTPTDTESPIINIVSPEERDYERSLQLAVNISAQDSSGVFALETILGTTTIPNIGVVDLFFLKLGTHTLAVSSSDNVGNATTSNRTFKIIATASSTLSDIDRTYALGWMTEKIHKTVSKKFKAITKISKKVERRTDGRPNGEKLQMVVDKILAHAMLNELQRYRSRGLSEQAYQLLREDILWLINN